MFKCSSIARWNVVMGRTRPKTSNRHLYIKKVGVLPNAALRNEKSSLLQASTIILHESLGFANFSWRCRAKILIVEVKEDLYLITLSITHSKSTMTGRGNNDQTLWLRCTRGDTLTSLPLRLAPPPPPQKKRGGGGGRITITGTGSPTGEATEGCTLQ